MSSKNVVDFMIFHVLVSYNLIVDSERCKIPSVASCRLTHLAVRDLEELCHARTGTYTLPVHQTVSTRFFLALPAENDGATEARHSTGCRRQQACIKSTGSVASSHHQLDMVMALRVR